MYGASVVATPQARFAARAQAATSLGRRHCGWRGLAAVLLVAVCSDPAGAHQRSMSYSEWAIREGGARVVVRLAALDASWLGLSESERSRAADVLGTYLADALQLWAGKQPCRLAGPPRPLEAPAGELVYEWDLQCPSGALEIRSGLLFDLAPSHLHFARVVAAGGVAQERVLSDGERAWSLCEYPRAAPRGWRAAVARYAVLGVEHIWTGYDHLAFLAALLLGGAGLVEVTKIVTGFTVGHTLTLALAALGYARPDRSAIEALVGFSICLVAAENLWLRGRRTWIVPGAFAAALLAMGAAACAGFGRVAALTLVGLGVFAFCYFGLLASATEPLALRWAIALVFGLVHGFAFAGALAEARLPAARLVPALFGFNAGVEAGQLVAVAATFPILARLTSGGSRRGAGWLVEASSAAIFGLGAFWFAHRCYR